MNGAATRACYRRLQVVWRDLGDEVLVLPPAPATRVLVLGGGSAVVWRHLESGGRADELARVIGGGITEDEVIGALELIVSAGLALREQGQ